VARDYFKGLHRLRALLGAKLLRGAVVYGGTTTMQPRSEYAVVPALECDALLTK